MRGVYSLNEEESMKWLADLPDEFVTGRCKACSEGTLHLSVHALSTEQTKTNDMVPAQWERTLNGRQACHPKTISSTSNFISQFQGRKQRLESSAFTEHCTSQKSTNMNFTSLKTSSVCSSKAEAPVRKSELRIKSVTY